MARRLTKEQVISNAYYDLEKGFGSIQGTLKQAKEKDPSIARLVWARTVIVAQR